jgi:hypothetical protein
MENKNIKDYLHLYIGCQCQMMGQEDETQTFKLTGVSFDDTQNVWWAYFAATEEMYAVIEDVFPILRPLADITEDEAKEGRKMFSNMADSDYSQGEIWAAQTRHWLSKGFDLFGLIESGLAIDKTKLTDHGN